MLSLCLTPYGSKNKFRVGNLIQDDRIGKTIDMLRWRHYDFR